MQQGQGYGKPFAGVYNKLWTGFALQVAPIIYAWHQAAGGEKGKRILDVCCGTGQLLLFFLEHGYTGTGIDLSAEMLSHARENCARFVSGAKVDFVQADASDFRLPGRYDLAVSTFDALNHLASLEALRACLVCVKAALVKGGAFIFDLNTERGLRRWNAITVEDGEQVVLINRGLFSRGMDRAYTRITGFTRTGPETWNRFEETAFNTVFRMADVKDALNRAGFQESWFAAGRVFTQQAADPEDQDRAYIIARS
jgi:SAM-dependent methyltransferase